MAAGDRNGEPPRDAPATRNKLGLTLSNVFQILRHTVG